MSKQGATPRTRGTWQSVQSTLWFKTTYSDPTKNALQPHSKADCKPEQDTLKSKARGIATLSEGHCNLKQGALQPPARDFATQSKGHFNPQEGALQPKTRCTAMQKKGHCNAKQGALQCKTRDTAMQNDALCNPKATDTEIKILPGHHALHPPSPHCARPSLLFIYLQGAEISGVPPLPWGPVSAIPLQKQRRKREAKAALAAGDPNFPETGEELAGRPAAFAT